MARREADGAVVFEGTYENDERVEGKALTPEGWKDFKRQDKNGPVKQTLAETPAAATIVKPGDKKNETSKEACCAIF